MRQINRRQTLSIPEGVKVNIKSRVVRVSGPRGVLTRDFKHVRVDLFVEDNKIVCELWFGNRKALAKVRSTLSHIKNMFDGVTKGFCYKMRLVYAHFPISASVEDEGQRVEIRNFIGQKVVREVKMLPGVIIERGKRSRTSSS